MSAPSPLPTAADILAVARSVRDAAEGATILAAKEPAAFASGRLRPAPLRQMLSDASWQWSRAKVVRCSADALYRAVALCYLRVAGNDWHALTGQAAWDVARRAVELADEL